jgi:hypothetical protein
MLAGIAADPLSPIVLQLPGEHRVGASREQKKAECSRVRFGGREQWARD